MPTLGLYAPHQGDCNSLLFLSLPKTFSVASQNDLREVSKERKDSHLKQFLHTYHMLGNLEDTKMCGVLFLLNIKSFLQLVRTSLSL